MGKRTALGLILLLSNPAWAEEAGGPRFMMGVGLARPDGGGGLLVDSELVLLSSLLPGVTVTSMLGAEVADGLMDVLLDVTFGYGSSERTSSGFGSSKDTDVITVTNWSFGLSGRINFVAPAEGALVPNVRFRGFYGQIVLEETSASLSSTPPPSVGGTGASSSSTSSPEDTFHIYGAGFTFGLEYLVSGAFGVGVDTGLTWSGFSFENESSSGTVTSTTKTNVVGFSAGVYVSFRK